MKEVKLYECSICKTPYNNEIDAEVCELIPLCDANPVNVGDIVLITMGEADGELAVVVERWVHPKSGYLKRYWHTVGIYAQTFDGSYVDLRYDGYEVQHHETGNTQMNAEILPLEGKYYGTQVKITDEDGHEFTIKLWNNGNFEPSDRELQTGEVPVSIEQWRSNELVDVEPDEYCPDGKCEAREVIYIADSHFESRVTLKMAETLCDAINSL